MASTAERTLALKLIADVGALDKSMKKVDGRLAKSRKAVVSWGKAFSGALVIGGLEKTVELVGDAWAGFRQGQKVAAQLGLVWKNLGLAGNQLAGTLDKVTTSATNLGFSDDDAVQAFQKALVATKDQDAAMRRLKIAYDLVASGAAPDLSSAMDVIRMAAKGSARVVDKYGLTAKTAGGRVKQLGEKFRGAAKGAAKLDPVGLLFNGLREDLEAIVGAVATGDEEGGLNALGSAGDRIGDAWGAAGGAVPALKDLVDNVAPKVTATLQALGGVVGAFGSAWDSLKPIVQPVLDLFGAALTAVSGDAVKALNAIASALKGDFAGAWNIILGVVRGAVGGMIAAWNRLDFSVPPFDLTWGGGTVFPGTPLAFDIPSGSFRFWSGTGDLFPDIGGSRGGGPGGRRGGGASGKPPRASLKNNLPSHEDGLDYVPYDDYLFRGHQGEAVLNKQDAAAWRSGGGGITVIVNGYVGSPQQLAQEINRVLKGGVQRGMRIGA